MEPSKRQRRWRLLAAWLLAVLSIYLLTGCGYRRIGASVEAPQHFTVAVPVLRNLTYRPGIEGPFTEAIVQSLVRQGVRVRDGATADYIVAAEIVSLDRVGDAFSAKDTAVEYKNEVTVDLVIRNRLKGEPLVRERIRRRVAVPAESLALQSGVDRAAIEDLASQVGRAVVFHLLALPPEERQP